MKIGMLTTGFPRFEGDLFGSFVLELARALVHLDENVLIVAPHERGVPQCEWTDGMEVQRFKYLLPTCWQRVAYGGGIPSNLRRSWLARLQVPLFLLGFWFAARRAGKQCNLLHCHWTISGLIASWATRGRSLPLVLSVRGSDIHLLGKGLLQRLNQHIYRRMDRIVAVSEDIARKLEEAGVEPDKLRVVYNGVDQRFKPADKLEMRRQLVLPQECFLVLFVGLLVPIKGLDVLLRALGQVGDQRLHCAIVGDGPLKGELETEVRQLKLDKQVRFCGRRPTAEIPAWINAADVLVLPSRSEGRPNVVLEAQACGVPVIATRVGGTPELVRDGVNGLLIDSEDVEALAQRLVLLMKDQNYRQQLGKRARENIVGGNFSWDYSARSMQEIYRELLEVT